MRPRQNCWPGPMPGRPGRSASGGNRGPPTLQKPRPGNPPWGTSSPMRTGTPWEPTSPLSTRAASGQISGPDKLPGGNYLRCNPLNLLIKMDLTGQQIYALLNQQFAPYQTYDRILQVSGLSYCWDARRPDNDRIIEIRQGGAAIDRTVTYTVTVNSFLAEGGDKFSVFTAGRNPVAGPEDLEALVSYVKKLRQPFQATKEGRIQRLN